MWKFCIYSRRVTIIDILEQIKFFYNPFFLLTLTFEHTPDDLGVNVDGLEACSTMLDELTVWLCLRPKKEKKTSMHLPTTNIASIITYTLYITIFNVYFLLLKSLLKSIARHLKQWRHVLFQSRYIQFLVPSVHVWICTFHKLLFEILTNN